MRVLALIVLAACAAGVEAPQQTAEVQTRSDDLEFTALAPGVWMHTAYKDVPPYGPIRTNGLIVASVPGEAVLIDSAWDDAQTARIVAWSRKTLGRRIAASVHTHAHDDKMGGVAALMAAGVVTYASVETNAAAPPRGLTPAARSLPRLPDGTLETPDALGPIEVLYPGPGHTSDNVVVRVIGTDVLFGGCLIRPGRSTSLGNTVDGDVSRWGDTVRTVAARFPHAHLIVPSHGAPGGRALLDHTAALADDAAR